MIIDFKTQVTEKYKDSAVNMLLVLSALQALEDITQEINIAIRFLTNGSGTLDGLEQYIKSAEPPELTKLFTLATLAKLHGNNLASLSETIKTLVLKRTTPDAEEIEDYIKSIEQRYKECTSIAERYADQATGTN